MPQMTGDYDDELKQMSREIARYNEITGGRWNVYQEYIRNLGYCWFLMNMSIACVSDPIPLGCRPDIALRRLQKLVDRLVDSRTDDATDGEAYLYALCSCEQ
jgi:hypothetical protein